MGSKETVGGDCGTIDWNRDPFARVLLKWKHTLPLMLAVYEGGTIGTSDLIRDVRGHPESVIRTIRALECAGVLSRKRAVDGHHKMEAHLTPRGIQLVETPICRWQYLLCNWDLASDSVPFTLRRERLRHGDVFKTSARRGRERSEEKGRDGGK